ncbi:MAG: hypothetical protein KDC14_00205 [Planctomycetes bacterium]|nr:hypothetical protein [Planctomycetota bacterium]
MRKHTDPTHPAPRAPEPMFADCTPDVRRGLDPELVAGLDDDAIIRLVMRRCVALRTLALPEWARRILSEVAS